MPSTILSDNGVTSGTSGLKSTGSNDGQLALQTTTAGGTATTALTIDTSQNVGLGTTSPAEELHVYRATGQVWNRIETGSSTNDAGVQFKNGTRQWSNFVNGTDGRWRVYDDTAVAERMCIDSSGNVGIGTSSPNYKLQLNGVGAGNSCYLQITQADAGTANTDGLQIGLATGASPDAYIAQKENANLIFQTNSAERARITSGGDLLVGTTVSAPGAAGDNTAGAAIKGLGNLHVSVNSSSSSFNRKGDDGTLIAFNQDGTTEGYIGVSGTTVSYNGGNLARCAQLTTLKDDTLVKGTVMSNLDEMNVYTDAEGNPVDNEQLNKVKVSDVEGDVNVAGVFVNWTYDEAHQVDEINMAMTGDMIIRIAQGVVVQKGDLLMSAGDGTAKPQDDDIVRSKTVAKVTSNHVTCTYEDGSYCVPCVLMAC